MTAKKKVAPAEAKPKQKKVPVRYSPAIAESICAQLAEGKSLREICSTSDMPSETAVREWVIDDAHGFAAQYTRARDIGLDKLADEILQIANTPQVGIKTVSKATGMETTEADMVEHRRLQIDARKWYLSKLAPKRYGERLELAGSIGVKKSPADMTDEELTAIAAGKAKKEGV